MKKKKQSKGSWIKRKATYKSSPKSKATIIIKKGEGRYL
jgi:hypothetical protein